jgi:hypothetical protein
MYLFLVFVKSQHHNVLSLNKPIVRAAMVDMRKRIALRFILLGLLRIVLGLSVLGLLLGFSNHDRFDSKLRIYFSRVGTPFK